MKRQALEARNEPMKGSSRFFSLLPFLFVIRTGIRGVVRLVSTMWTLRSIPLSISSSLLEACPWLRSLGSIMGTTVEFAGLNLSTSTLSDSRGFWRRGPCSRGYGDGSDPSIVRGSTTARPTTPTLAWT